MGDRIIAVNLMGAVDVLRDFPLFYSPFFMAWWAVAIALTIGALSDRTDWVQQIWHPPRLNLQMFSAEWLPPPVRGVALLHPG
jgi:hypothetical protein